MLVAQGAAGTSPWVLCIEDDAGSGLFLFKLCRPTPPNLCNLLARPLAGFFLMLGSVGFRASLAFVRHIYKVRPPAALPLRHAAVCCSKTTSSAAYLGSHGPIPLGTLPYPLRVLQAIKCE